MSQLPRLARRDLLAGMAVVAASPLLGAPAGAAQSEQPRMRVIVDNDLGGDPDGLFALAHLLASPSVAVPLVIGSHLHRNEPFDPSSTQGQTAAARARELVSHMKLPSLPAIVAGRDFAPERAAPAEATPSVRAIIAEAMREDSKLPLYYVAGAGLTELAEACRIEPRIAKRLTLVWIGGNEHPELMPTLPPRTDPEYNLTIDLAAAQDLFANPDLTIWQVPRNAYRTMLISFAELETGLKRAGRLGTYLFAQLMRVTTLVREHGFNLGETYILGDSPLVTLTALHSPFEPDASSSTYVVMPTPHIRDDGTYEAVPGARPMRVFASTDTRLTFGDMFAKLTRASR